MTGAVKAGVDYLSSSYSVREKTLSLHRSRAGYPMPGPGCLDGILPRSSRRLRLRGSALLAMSCLVLGWDYLRTYLGMVNI